MYELVIAVREAVVDDLSDALEALGALSVSVEDADALTFNERPLFGEPGMPPPASGWQQSIVKALFADSPDAEHAQTVCAAQPFFTDCRSVSLAAVPDTDWVRLTQAQFAPVEVTETFWIVPTWHETPTHAVQVIRLDPGLAFGTGTHPTTQMCLRWIAGHAWDAPASAPVRVLDYGCGSGILAIAAALFCDARQTSHIVTGVDLDEAAVHATQANATANAVSVQAGLPNHAQGLHEVVLANILATPLKVLAPLLCSHLAPGAHLVLAGILEQQASELIDAYAPWCSLQIADRQDGWILMTAQPNRVRP